MPTTLDPPSKKRSPARIPGSRLFAAVKRRADPLAHPSAAEAEAEPDVEQLNDPRVVHALPAELLQPDEMIILLVKPSPWFIILTAARSLAILTLLIMAGFVLDARGINLPFGRSDMMLIYMVLVAMRLGWQFMEWLSHVYVMTDKRVIRVMGFVNVRVFETPLQNVRHTDTYFTLRERVFGLGTIGFATAGTGHTEAYWHMVARPLEVHQVVVRTLNRYRR